MVKQQDKSSPPVWVAIDVAKRRNEVLIEHPDRARRQRLSVLNTREAHYPSQWPAAWPGFAGPHPGNVQHAYPRLT